MSVVCLSVIAKLHNVEALATSGCCVLEKSSLKSNPNVRDDRPGTNCLNHGTDRISLN